MTYKTSASTSAVRSDKNNASTAVLRKETPWRQVVQRAQIDPHSLTAADVKTLQRSIGNRATTALLQPVIQTQLKVGPANDPYEQEANQVAEQVSRQVSGSAPTDQETLQASTIHGPEGGDVDSRVEHQLAQTGSGKPLDVQTQRTMESNIGADFSKVRIHTDQTADQLNRSLNATAFTKGNDIYFSRGQYNPGSAGGQKLLAHELTHTVQQGASAPAESIRRDFFSRKKKAPAPPQPQPQPRKPRQEGEYVLKIKKDALEKQNANNKKTEPETSVPAHPEALYVGRLIADLDGSFKAMLGLSNAGKSLDNVRQWQMPNVSSIEDDGLRSAVQAWFDSIPSAMQNVLDSPETLIVPRTDEEIAADQAYEDHLAQKRYLRGKMAKQAKKYRNAWTGWGKAHHKKKHGKYQARLDNMPDDNTAIHQTEKVTKGRQQRQADIAWGFLTDVKAKYKAIAAAVGGIKALNLPEGTDPVETLFIMIGSYASDLNKD